MHNGSWSMVVGSGAQERAHAAAQLRGIDSRAAQNLGYEPQFAGQSICVHAPRLHFLQQVFAAKVNSQGQGIKKMLQLNELAPRGQGFL